MSEHRANSHDVQSSSHSGWGDLCLRHQGLHVSSKDLSCIPEQLESQLVSFSGHYKHTHTHTHTHTHAHTHTGSVIAILHRVSGLHSARGLQRVAMLDFPNFS